MISFPQDEIKRKLFHFSIIFYIAAYYFLPKSTVIIGLIVLIAIAGTVEVVRAHNHKFNALMLKMFSGIYRKSEEHQVTGIVWTLIGAVITIIVFDDKSCVIASFFYLALGDSAAALVGRSIGKHKIYGGKSLEGSFACFIVCLIAGLFIFDSWQLALAGGLIATFVESIPWPLSDNLWMQIVNAGALTAVKMFLPV